MIRTALVTLCLVLLFSECQSQSRPRYVLLVSFDGFRFDYVDKFNAPNFKKFIKAGVAAEGLIPSYPSKTFPNHYTLVTGLVPGHHGIVDNSFYDPSLHRKFGMSDTLAVMDASFYGGVPLWNLVQEQGLKSASLFWVGSEAPIGGKWPDYYLAYDESMPDRARVDQVMEWFRLPADARPRFVSLYFEVVDTEGHTYGTESKETAAAVKHADTILGYITDELTKLPFEVNVVIVSDHGMLELALKQETYLIVDEILGTGNKDLQVISTGTQVHIYGENLDSLFQHLKERELHFKVLRKPEFPVQWHYHSDRVGDVLLVADKGYYFRMKPFDAAKLPPGSPNVFGVHGYDADVVPEMKGIFYAMGPHIAKGKIISAFRNIHVYPFLARLLGVDPPETDGDPRVLKKVLR